MVQISVFYMVCYLQNSWHYKGLKVKTHIKIYLYSKVFPNSTNKLTQVIPTSDKILHITEKPYNIMHEKNWW